MISPKVDVYSENQISNRKQKFKDYFSMENSLGHLMEVAKDFYVVSIGIDIYNGIKNPKRFRVIILHIICFGFFTVIFNLFMISNYLYSLIKESFIPGNFKIFIIVIALAAIWILVIKIDMTVAEIKLNLCPLKVFYFLIKNIKPKHKLIDLNYTRLAILSRLIQLGILDYGGPMAAIMIMGLCVLITILSQKFIWIFICICFLFGAIIGIVSFSIWMSINLIIFLYYKMRFDQIHSSIKSILSNGDVINKRREIQLSKLIKEHKSVSSEIHKLNSMLRRSAGAMSIALTIVRIILLYLLINFNNNIFLNIVLIISFSISFIFGFGLTYLFSRQIKSAHQNDKLIYLILCTFNMRLRFKFKVN